MFYFPSYLGDFVAVRKYPRIDSILACQLKKLMLDISIEFFYIAARNTHSSENNSWVRSEPRKSQSASHLFPESGSTKNLSAGADYYKSQEIQT